jgi:hypothetical protein
VEDIVLWFFIAGLAGRNSVNTKKTFNFHVLTFFQLLEPFFNFWGISYFRIFQLLTVFSTFGAFFQLFAGVFVFVFYGDPQSRGKIEGF